MTRTQFILIVWIILLCGCQHPAGEIYQDPNSLALFSGQWLKTAYVRFDEERDGPIFIEVGDVKYTFGQEGEKIRFMAEDILECDLNGDGVVNMLDFAIYSRSGLW